MLDEPCQRCGKAPAVRLLGTVAHCRPCAEAFLAPLRRKYGVIKIRRPEVIRTAAPDYPGMIWLRCHGCHGEWVGNLGDDCQSCQIREQRMRDDERKRLLFPEWASNHNGVRYDDLSDVDKAVWRQTRGQTRDDDAVSAWANALANAVAVGDISEADAEAAIKRLGEP